MYIAKSPSASRGCSSCPRDADADGQSDDEEAHAGAILYSGTLKGFPNPPAMVRGEQSSPAPHASDVEHVKDDGKAAVAQRVARGGPQAQLTFGFEPGGGDDGGAPATKVRP